MRQASTSEASKAHARPAAEADLASGKGVSMMPPSPLQLQVIQFKDTKISHRTGTISVNGEARRVGKSMHADLNPYQPVKGSATGVNSDWMKWIRAKYKKANVVRGHLLNHDLGGFGIEENLYPISTKANADHSSKVEQNVKGALTRAYNNDGWVEYSVKVKENDDYVDASFDCTWKEYDNGDKVVNEDHQEIPSNLDEDTGGFGGGSRSQVSPSAWRHGKSRGGKEVKAVKTRLDDAIKDGLLTIDRESKVIPKKKNGINLAEYFSDLIEEEGRRRAILQYRVLKKASWRLIASKNVKEQHLGMMLKGELTRVASVFND